MDPSPGSQPQRIALEDLAALNREMSALVASGLPLEAGLRQVADDFNGPTGQLAARLAEETASGKTLEQAIAAQGDSLPDVYRAVVAAGVRSGRLAAALEGYAEAAARMAALRRILGQSAIYPMIVVIVAWVMLIVVVAMVMPGYNALETQHPSWLARLEIPGWLTLTLLVVVPAALIISASAWWRASAAAPAGYGAAGRSLRWAPGVRRTAELSANANFADLLHMLLACRSPMHEALPLAANACGNRAFAPPAVELSRRVAAGLPLRFQTEPLRQLPPLVRTVLLADLPEDRLIAGLKRAADNYRERAAGWLTDMAIILPVAITFVLSIGVVGVYAVIILQPYYGILNELTYWGWQ